MFSDSNIISVIKEKIWVFQLKYSPVDNEWTAILIPFVWLFTMPFWLPKHLIEDKSVVIQFIMSGAMLLLFGLFTYLYIITGKANQEMWKKEIFPQHIAQIFTKVYDSTDKMIGGIANDELNKTNKGTFYVEDVPKLYWNILKFREENYLKFNNKGTGLFDIIDDPRSFNGVDALGIPSAISKGRGGSSLSQQLVKNFYGQDYFTEKTSFRTLNTIFRKIQELDEAKTFYHNLRANNGEAFKRWISMYPPSLVSDGSVYGIESVSAVMFGKKPKDLAEYEQVLLSEMYKYTYYFKSKINEKKCKLIKRGAEIDIANYFKGKTEKIAQLNQEVENWTCPTQPRIPFAFYKNLQEQDAKGRAIIGNPNSRIWEWAGTSAVTLRDELDIYREKYKNRLIIEAKMTLDVPKNIDFKNAVNSALSRVERKIDNHLYVDLDGNSTEGKPQANIWVSVVDENGEIKHIYKRGNTSDKRRIGSISKVFEAIALGNRGDKYDYFYCNEPFKGLHNSDGSVGGDCVNNQELNIYSARKVFGASKNLPMRSAFDKYMIKSNREIRVVKDEISDKTLNQIYDGFNLSRDNNTNLRYELSFGVTNSSPLNLQKAIHKLSHLLYYKRAYKEAHITESLKYKTIKDSSLRRGQKDSSIYATHIEKATRVLFGDNTKIYMKTVLKSALNKKYGTLNSFNYIKNFEQLFMKSGSTDKVVDGEKLTQSKWVVGAIRVKGKPYSFVIMVHNENGIGKRVKHREIMKPIFREIVEALNR